MNEGSIRFRTLTSLLLWNVFFLGPVLGQDLETEVLSSVAERATEIEMIASRLWEDPETALRETRSAAFLAELLERAGFTVERGVAGMPTAFVGTFGRGKPTIGILAEFDALPGVGNEVLPEKVARSDGVTAGQGCGHNLFAAASVGSALALKDLIQAGKLEGTIKLFGTPAEETLVGKVYMVKAGLFDNVEAVLDWHPSLETKVRNQPGRAMNNFEVEFFGQAAHASSDPWNGRSALDAVELLNFGVNLMREHVKPTARIHYVITEGGEAPNVVPDYAKVWYYVRAENRAEVDDYYRRIHKIVEGAALATGTTSKVNLITGVHEYLLNRPFQEAIQKNLLRAGPVRFSEADQTFARRLQRSLGLEEKGLDAEVKALPEKPEPTEGGSTDVADVSRVVPTAGFSLTTAAAGVPWHSWATTACHGTEGARRAAVTAAKVLALTGVDLLTKPDLLAEIKAAFDEATAGSAYESPVPGDQQPQLPQEGE